MIATLTQVAGHPQISIDMTNDNATVNIADNDGPGLWSITGSQSVDEGNVTDDYVISLSGQFGQGESASITLQFDDGNASALDLGNAFDNSIEYFGLIRSIADTRSDLSFDDSTGILTFTAANDGDSMAEIRFTLNATDDNIVEADESFTLSLSQPTTATGANVALDLTNSSVQTTIIDDDTAALSVSDVTVTEDGVMTFTAILDTHVHGGFDVDLSFTGNTATGLGVDFDSQPQTLSFAGNAGEAITLHVQLNDDDIVESAEDFTVSFTNLITSIVPSSKIDATDTATGTILDNDDATITIQDVTINEDETMTFTATLSDAVDGGLSVDVDFANGSAEDDDYNNTSQTLTFAGVAGETVTFTVPVNNDLIVEPDEQFSVSLSNLATATAPVSSIDITDTATGTIIDDDVAAITVDDTSTLEDGSLTFTATLNTSIDGGLTVDALLSDITASGNGQDYNGITQRLFFAGNAGEQVQFTVPVTDDNLVENAEQLSVSLTNLISASGLQSTIDISDTAVGTIFDNDSAVVSIIANDPNAGEPNNDGQFTVTMTTRSSEDTSVFYAITGSAGSSDTTVTSGIATIAAGQLSTTIDVSVIDDVLIEGSETVIATLTNISAGISGTAIDAAQQTDTVTIADNDGPALWNLSGPSVIDEGASAEYELTLSGSLRCWHNGECPDRPGRHHNQRIGPRRSRRCYLHSNCRTQRRFVQRFDQRTDLCRTYRRRAVCSTDDRVGHYG